MLKYAWCLREQPILGQVDRHTVFCNQWGSIHPRRIICFPHLRLLRHENLNEAALVQSMDPRLLMDWYLAVTLFVYVSVLYLVERSPQLALQ